MAQLVYLDQNKWIQIARIRDGKDSDARSRRLLEFLYEAKKAGHLKFPLSFSHYWEIKQIGSAERRQKLASAMADLSDLETLAPNCDLIRHEVERALLRRYPSRVSIRPFSLLGRGIGHVTGKPRSFHMEDPHGVMEPKVAREFEARANALFELTALGGPGTWGLEVDLSHIPKNNADDRFVEILNKLPDEIASILSIKTPLPVADELRIAMFFRGRCLSDIQDIVEDIIAFHAVDDLRPSKARPDLMMMWGDIVSECPSRAIDMHLMRQFAANRQLKRERTDLNDVAYIGIGASVCDVVVCEKQMASLLNRPGISTKAKVIARLEDLMTIQ